MGDAYLVMVLHRAKLEAEKHGEERDEVDEGQLEKILPEIDDKGHHQEIRKIEKVFARSAPLHIVHDGQVEVQVQDGKQPGQKEASPQVKMIGYDKKIRRRQIDQCADIKTIGKVADDTNEIRDEREQDELVEPYRLSSPGYGIVCSQARVDDILIEGLEKLDEVVAQRSGF